MRTTPILSGFHLVLICLLMFGQLHPAFADPIHDGAARGDVQAIEHTLATGADIEAGKSIGWKPLHAAGRWNRPEAMALLLDNGANTDADDDYGGTALHLSALVGKPRGQYRYC